MNKQGMGMGAGMVAMMAVCCGGKLLLLSLGLPALTVATGEMVLIAAAAVVAIAAVGLFLWRRRSASCADTTCAPGAAKPTHSQALDVDPAEVPTSREPVAAGHQERRRGPHG